MTPKREFLVVFLLAAIAVSMVAVASITNSYVPLFLAWLPYGAIPMILARADRVSPPEPPPSQPASRRS